MKRKGEGEQQPQKKAKPARKKSGGGIAELVQKLFSGDVKRQGSGMGRYMAMALIPVLVVGAGLAGAMAWLQFGEHQERAEEQLAAAVVQQQAGVIGLAMRSGERLAETWAESAAVARVLEAPEGERDALVEELSAQVPEGRLWVIPAEDRIPRDDLSYTARDLVQQARRDDRPEPVMLPETPPVMLVARATSDGNGVVLIQQSQELMYQQLQRMELLGGSFEIIAEDVNATVLRRGDAVDGPSATATAGNLALTYTAQAGEQDAELMTLFVTIMVGAITLLLAVIAISFRSAVAAMRKDVSLLRQYGEDLRRPGSTRSRGQYQFSALASLTELLDHLFARAGTGSMETPEDLPDDADPLDGMLVESAGGALLDDELNGAGEETAPPAPAPPEEIFRENDIRGVVGQTLTVDGVEQIGRAIGSVVSDAGESSVVVGRDGRASSGEITDALVRGLNASGCDVVDLGMVPAPLVYYASRVLNTPSAVCVTGSHNSREYNGLKVLVAGQWLHGDRLRDLRGRIEKQEFTSGNGTRSESDITRHYIDAVATDIVLARPMKVVVDCASGVAGVVAPQLLEQLECQVTPLFAEVDGSFPHHGPDPGQPENLEALVSKVKEEGADLGIAFDGDGDRLVAVAPSGEILWPDRLMMCFARDLLSRSPGSDILFDVKSSRELPKLIARMGGRPLMWKSGHSLMKAKLAESGAPLAGEMSGHIYFADRWYGFDDAIYAAARLLEILSLESSGVDEIFARLKTGISTPELSIPVPEERKAALVQKLSEAAEFEGGKVSTLDGLRVDFQDGWGLVRASDTGAALMARFEGQDKGALERIQQQFRERLQAVAPELELPF